VCFVEGNHMVPAAQPESAFVPASGKDLDRIFSVQQERVVNRDNTVSVGGRVLQIDRVRWRGMLAGCRVLLCEHLDGPVSRVLRPPPDGSVSRGSAEPRGGQKLWKRRRCVADCTIFTHY
jgi:hypothetical protein